MGAWNRGPARGLVWTDLELELKARKAAVAGDVIGPGGRGHGGLQLASALATVLVLVLVLVRQGRADGWSLRLSRYAFQGLLETAGATASLCPFKDRR